MNKIILSGRWTRDPEIKYTGEGLAIAKGTLAVDRRFAKKDDEQKADFISVVAFGKIAEHIEKWHTKGMKAAIVGRIQTGSYTNKEGNKVYTTDVIIEEIEFCEVKNLTETVQEGKVEGDGFIDAGTEGSTVFDY